MSHDENSQVPAAEQPTGDDQWIFNLAADHEARGNGLYGPVTFSATGLVDFVKDVAAHLASQSQAAQPSELTDEQIEDAVQGIYLSDYPESSGYDIAIARAAIAAHLAGQSQATRAVPEGWREVIQGMRDASYTITQYPETADIVFDSVMDALADLESDAKKAAQEVTQQAAKAETGAQALTREQIDTIAMGNGMFTYGYEQDPGDFCYRFARKIESEVARRFRAQGGNTNAESSDLAPTTSTVSAPEEPYGWVFGNSFWERGNPRITDEVKQLGKPLFDREALRTTSGKGGV